MHLILIYVRNVKITRSASTSDEYQMLDEKNFQSQTCLRVTVERTARFLLLAVYRYCMIYRRRELSLYSRAAILRCICAKL